MTRQRLLSFGGYALIASAVLSLAGGMAHPVVDGGSHNVASLTAPASPWAQLLIYAGALALMIGLPVAYGWLAPRIGWLGFTGFLLYFVGNAVSAQGHLYVEALVAPDIARRAPELVPADGSIVDAPLFVAAQIGGGLVLMSGVILLGLALAISGAVPRWIGVVGVVGGLLLLVPLPEAPVLTGLHVELGRGLMVAALGVLMIREARGRTVAQASPERLAHAG